MVTITEVAKNSRAARKGVAVGDVLVSINGREISDVLDYRFFLTNTEVTLSLLRNDAVTGKQSILRGLRIAGGNISIGAAGHLGLAAYQFLARCAFSYRFIGCR